MFQNSNSHYVVASALCKAISSSKQGIASTEERRLATTWLILRIAVFQNYGVEK
jgi:hypothetical protein